MPFVTTYHEFTLFSMFIANEAHGNAVGGFTRAERHNGRPGVILGEKKASVPLPGC